MAKTPKENLDLLVERNRRRVADKLNLDARHRDMLEKCCFGVTEEEIEADFKAFMQEAGCRTVPTPTGRTWQPTDAQQFMRVYRKRRMATRESREALKEAAEDRVLHQARVKAGLV